GHDVIVLTVVDDHLGPKKVPSWPSDVHELDYGRVVGCVAYGKMHARHISIVLLCDHEDLTEKSQALRDSGGVVQQIHWDLQKRHAGGRLVRRCVCGTIKIKHVDA